MNPYLIIILIILISFFILDTLVELLNIKAIQTKIPNEFKDVYPEEKYKKSQEYLKESTQFKLISSSLSVIITCSAILLGGFNFLDIFVRNIHLSPLVTGIVYMLALAAILQVISFPFSWYSTFVIEEKYGFNKTTPKTFFLDILKSTALVLVVGIPIIAAILWFFETYTQYGWIMVWATLVAFQLLLVYLAPTFIMPLFNKFQPIESGELKDRIETYAKTHQFSLKGIYTMDGSKRSSKSNAFFTGFGKQRRIVLFDTLIEKHSIDELECILAHEMGHYKKHHIHQTLIISILSTGLTFYVLSLFLLNPHIAAAFQVTTPSIYTSLIFFGFLFRPIEECISLASHALSRKNEFEADNFAKETTKNPEALISGLKKLSVDNLSNLNPHPLKVALSYSHPPVLARINALKN